MPYHAMAQRLQQKLERSVVAVCNGSSTVNVTWRKLAQDPEDTKYNIYTRTSGGSYTLLNATPLTKTNYQTTTQKIPYGTEIAVTSIVGNEESEKSLPFAFQSHTWKDLFFDFDFESSVLTPSLYKCKYAWPMDIDGTGRMDAVLVDRLSTDGSSHKLQAYRLDGTCLWTIDMGPNIEISGGQNDNVTVYDINCDGKCEVIIKTSDGTRFWDQQTGSWGKYANHSESADTDGDGITDYTSSTTKMPPYYVSVVNGATGEEIDCAELKYSEINDGADSYSRNGRANYKNDSNGKEYAFLTGKFVIAYFDGIHPSLGVETYDRTTDGTHHYYMLSWQYDWNNGTPSNFHHATTWCRNGKSPYPAEFHQLRVADTNGDGKDAVLEGGFGWHPDQGLVYSAGIGHGDRFDVSDIDPDRPGMEVFAIQQSSLLGQILYDAKDGTHIKEWYLPSVTDVGRGRCMDVDASHKGMEMFSLLGGLYDCKGNLIQDGSVTYPNEAIWWDGDLQRELIGSPGGSGYATNVIVQKYDGTRHINFSSESSWAVHSGWANRPAFVGDMTGDWREEIILMKQNADTSTGLVGYSTDIATNYSMYTLQEDPHYRLDMTGRGYYQSPCTSFYLGGDMPTPPLPPTMVTDLRWKSGSQWATSTQFLNFDTAGQTAYADGKSVIFDISGDNSAAVNISSQLKPGNVYLMAPLGHDYTFSGTGSIAGTGEIWKSMQGTVTINNNISTTGKVTISEGTLCLNGTVGSDVDLKAKGTLAGTGSINGNMTFEGALNYEGCRLKPTGAQGVMTFGKSLTLPGNVYIEVEADDTSMGKISVKGDLTFSGSNIFTVNQSNLKPGTYTLAECTGTLTADVTTLSARGLDGVNYDFVVDGNALKLAVNDSRKALDDVTWTGATDTAWDYKTANFSAASTGATAFVNGDAVTFGDTAENKTVNVSDMVQPKKVVFDVTNGTYTLSGTGGISGTASVEKRGAGEVKLNLTASDYTGSTTIYGGTLTVSSIENGGTASCLGAADATKGNLVLAGGTLKVTGKNVATDRQVTVNDTSTVCVYSASGSLSFSGQVSGSGYLVKTGNGQLNFNYGGGNNFAGLIVKAGVVSQGAWNSTFGKSGSPMRLEGGEVRLIQNKNSSTRPIFDYVATVPAGAKAQVTNVYRSAINGKFLGEGQLTIVSDGVRGDIGADFSGFQGTLVAKGSNVRLMDNVTDMSQTTLQMEAAAHVGHYASNGSSTKAVTTKVGSLVSTATDCTLGNGVDTYSIGYNNASTTYAGLLNAATINKYGDGTLTLKTVGSTSAINIYGGEVSLKNSFANGVAITSGAIAVNNGGTLTGTGCAGAVTVNKGGRLTVGTETNVGTIKFVGDVKLNSGSTVKVKVRGTSSVTSDKYYFTGNVTHNNDTILVEVYEKSQLAEGDEITVFRGAGIHSGKYILKTVSPDRQITWDDSQLLTSGILKVASCVTTGIDGTTIVNADTMVDVYTPGGILVRHNVRRAEALKGLPQNAYIIKVRK